MQAQCRNCVLDKSAEEITFDENGVCNFCLQAQKTLKENERERINLPNIIKDIRDSSGEYDCLIGLSGGVDSSRVLHEAVKLGLKPLCFSVDNGYNDPKADENIMRMVETSRVPFYRYVLNLKKFRELQTAFMKAGLKNIEIPTDHVLMALSYDLSSKHG